MRDEQRPVFEYDMNGPWAPLRSAERASEHGRGLGFDYHTKRLLRLSRRQEIARLRYLIDAALHELGEPQTAYPAPVANAIFILRGALKESP